MLEMAKRRLLPAVTGYTKKLVDAALAKKALSEELDCFVETALAEKLSNECTAMYKSVARLEKAVASSKNIKGGAYETAKFYRDEVLQAMAELRGIADSAEEDVDAGFWPYPTYGELLFKV